MTDHEFAEALTELVEGGFVALEQSDDEDAVRIRPTANGLTALEREPARSAEPVYRGVPRAARFWIVAVLVSLALCGPTSALAQDARSLYAPLVGAEPLDWHSTTSALQLAAARGVNLQEGNPVLRGCVTRRSCLLAVKMGAGAFTIWQAERLRAHGHPRAAFWITFASTVGTAAIATNNYRLTRQAAR